MYKGTYVLVICLHSYAWVTNKQYLCIRINKNKSTTNVFLKCLTHSLILSMSQMSFVIQFLLLFTVIVSLLFLLLLFTQMLWFYCHTHAYSCAVVFLNRRKKLFLLCLHIFCWYLFLFKVVFRWVWVIFCVDIPV